MATDHPMGDSRLAPLDLPAAHVDILRRELSGWVASLGADLENPERLEDPDRARAEAAAYRRLLGALDAGRIALPDERAARLLREAADAHDQATDYQEVVATHDAMHALLAALGRR